jgi:hypothetical protein
MIDDVPDYELHKPAGTTPHVVATRRSSMSLWLIVLALAAAAGAGAYLFFASRKASVVAVTRTRVPIAAAPQPVLGQTSDAMALPPLDETDAVVRQLVQGLTSDPLVMRWLGTQALIRHVALVIANVADGRTPAKQLQAVKPAGPFSVVACGNATCVNPQTYHRYDSLAHIGSSIDPAAVAHLFGLLKPRIEDAYRELGIDRPLDRTVEAAVVHLLETPIVEGPVRLVPKGIGYEYADDRLAALSDAQRQLLRMGPENVRVVQGFLRTVAVALGMDQQHLPAPRNYRG